MITPSLRELHSEMADRLRRRASGDDERFHLFVEDTDLLVDSLNSIGELVEGSSSRV